MSPPRSRPWWSEPGARAPSGSAIPPTCARWSTPSRAGALRTAGYAGRVRRVPGVKEAPLEARVGGILNLGETREQRVEMTFQLAEIDPTSVPINLLNPRSGTKFGDRELMEPWEAVKCIAI